MISTSQGCGQTERPSLGAKVLPRSSFLPAPGCQTCSETGQDSCGNQGGGQPGAEAALVSKIKAKHCGEVDERREGGSEGVARARLGTAGPRSAQS